MKTTACLIVLFSVLSSFALDPLLPVAREVGGVVVETRDALPEVWEATWPYRSASWRWESDGWRNRTAQELSDEAAAAAVAASNAAYLASLPEPHPRGIEVPYVVFLSETNDYGIGMVAADDGDVATFLFHASPVVWADVEARKAEALSGRRSLKLDLRALKASLTNNIAQTEAIDFSVTTAAGQGKSLADLRRELKDVQQDLNKLRRVVAAMARESAE